MNYFLLALVIVGVVLAIAAYSKVTKIETTLKEKGILPDDLE